MKSDSNIGDASLIGLECESGDFSDCNVEEPDGHVTYGCDGVLIFSDINSTCGSMCESKRKKRSSFGRTGWTLFYTNQDSPRGSGDHENYFDFINKKHDRLSVYDIDGNEYINCKKKAIHVRQRDKKNRYSNLSVGKK